MNPHFRSNRCLAIHVTDLEKAAAFYGGVLGFRLVSGNEEFLEYDTGTLLLYINRSPEHLSPIPSLSVSNIIAAKQRLIAAGCVITDDRGSSFYFRDPFGSIFDVIEE